jgi:hypothetical protein
MSLTQEKGFLKHFIRSSGFVLNCLFFFFHMSFGTNHVFVSWLVIDRGDVFLL